MSEAAGPREKWLSHYDLELVRQAFRDGDFAMTNRVRRYFRRNPDLRASMLACIEGLSTSDFHKRQQHMTVPTRWLDVYRPWWHGCRLYVKLTERDNQPGFVALSFCRDGEAH